MAFPGRQGGAKAPSPSTRSPSPAGGDAAPAAPQAAGRDARLQICLKLIEVASVHGLEPQVMLPKADALAKWVLTGERPA